MKETQGPEVSGRRGLSRRELLRASWMAAFATGGESRHVLAGPAPQEEAESRSLVPLNRFPRMVHEHFVERVRESGGVGRTAKASLRTKADAESYVSGVREKIRRCFGPEPERTDLRPRVTGVVEREAYKIEKVIFESRPEFLVTANLYIPKGRRFPLPGVVGSCGHSANGKAAEPYQSFCQGLARMGYVVLIFDPIGQGERMQYTDADLKPRRGGGTAEHLLAGNQQFLVGEFFGSWRAWDGIRALDYLLTREEVDRRHVGVTGNSGGGTMTTWLCGLERRWTMAAPGCFVTTFRRNAENELPADTEQCPPGVLAQGLDHEDFLAAMAPKPVIILAKERDYFDVRGSQEAYERLKRLYSLLESPGNIGLHIGPTEHGYSQENREAMYRWFNRVTGVSAAASEPALTIEKDETLWCTPRGQVAGLGSRTVFSFTRARSSELGRKRAGLAGDALRTAVAEALAIPPKPAGPPEYRILRPLPRRRYPHPHATTYAVETENGVFALVTRLSDRAHYSRPPRGSGRAILYVSHHSADQELRDEPLVRSLIDAEPSAPFFACDLRGIGESRPGTCGADTFTSPYGSDYFYAIHSIMLGRPYVGQKTYDLTRVLDWLGSAGHDGIHLAAKGWGTLPALFAALLSDRVAEVTLKGAPPSYAAIAEAEEYVWPLSSFVPGVLSRFDLPDCFREIERSKGLRQIQPGSP